MRNLKLNLEEHVEEVFFCFQCFVHSNEIHKIFRTLTAKEVPFFFFNKMNVFLQFFFSKSGYLNQIRVLLAEMRGPV